MEPWGLYEILKVHLKRVYAVMTCNLLIQRLDQSYRI